jgi:hypothetical protein
LPFHTAPSANYAAQSQASQHIIDKLVETVGKPRTDRYSPSKGIGGESKL